ncbi:helix-turn-helix domain-containing protein [Lysobacter sp. Root494]|uniref:helix-turn-helix domain-containing protein n=1 Tax=Lysobacter sp. Root494 TaxID=1736549 RepID=UPI0006F6887A|nr:helix-turn-helix domain-containing protein [Lysobacter sp. Root494]KQY51193.1 hypothetical protein ASD14_10340 [Lysobacter sp. Root494]
MSQIKQSPHEAGNVAQAGGLSAEEGYNREGTCARRRPKQGTVAAKILEALEAGKSLTPLEAVEAIGTTRLGAYVFDLRRMGWPIEATMIAAPARGGRVAHVARYSLELASGRGIGDGDEQ